jgi:hypothetical protein
VVERENLRSESEQLHELGNKLKHKKMRFKKELAVLRDVSLESTDRIDLNVGGCAVFAFSHQLGSHFTTTKRTLCSFEGTMLSAMFSGRHKFTQDSSGR